MKEVSNMCELSRKPDTSAFARVWDSIKVVAKFKGDSLLFKFDELREVANVQNRAQWRAIMHVLTETGIVEPYLDCGEWYWWKVTDYARIKLKDFRIIS